MGASRLLWQIDKKINNAYQTNYLFLASIAGLANHRTKEDSGGTA